MNEEINKKIEKKQNYPYGISKSTSLRLPFYLRTLRSLLEENVFRISSTKLAKLMNMSDSQIRQDLSAIGACGLKGYGYDVNTLYTSILDLTCVRDEYSAVIFGTQEMITMLTSRPVFIKQGVALKKTFVPNSENAYTEFENFCRKNKIDIVVLATELETTKKAVEIIKTLDIKGVWNFSDVKLDMNIPVKNIWIDDSLMTLCYEIGQRNWGYDL